MAEVIPMRVDALDRTDLEQKDKPSSEELKYSSPPLPQGKHDREANDVYGDKDSDKRLPGERYDRNRSPSYRDREHKRGISLSPPPLPARDRKSSPRRSPIRKRSRRENGYDGRRGSPRGGHGDRRYGYDREGGGRHAYIDERPHGRYLGRMSSYHDTWDTSRGSFHDASNQREGLMSYKQFIQELEDDIVPSEAERRYQEYKNEYISTHKKVYFEAHKDEDWLKDKYHPTNLLSVIERRNEHARKAAKDFFLDLQSGTLDLSPAFNPVSRSGHASDRDSEEDFDAGSKRRRRSHGATKVSDLSVAPKAHTSISDPKRIPADIEQAQALARKLDSEKGIEDNILRGSGNEKSHGSTTGPVILVRGIASVKGLEGVELLDTLLTYLWRVHGIDYYGMIEKTKPKGLRHVRAEENTPEKTSDGFEWVQKFDARWEERLKGRDPLEIMAAKEKIDAAAIEAMDPYVRKIRDEKYGWKYGCGAKGCTKLFHAAEFVHKHLKLKHPDLVTELTAKVREDLYFQNYMDDSDAPGGTPVMQQSATRDRSQKRKPLEYRLKDDRGNTQMGDRPENMESGDAHSGEDGAGGNHDEAAFDCGFGGRGMRSTPPVLMPVPGAGPLGPFVPAPAEVAMQMFDSSGRGGRHAPQVNAPSPIILPQSLRRDPRRIRSYRDLDAPEEEVTVIDYRSL